GLEQASNALDGCVVVVLGIRRQQLQRVNVPRRVAGDDVGERAAAIDPEMPAVRHRKRDRARDTRLERRQETGSDPFLEGKGLTPLRAALLVPSSRALNPRAPAGTGSRAASARSTGRPRSGRTPSYTSLRRRSGISASSDIRRA